MFDNYTSDSFCYTNYSNFAVPNPEEYKMTQKVNLTKNIVYSFFKPFQSAFFYWTILLLVLHKFNFKKPVIKIIVAHYVLRIIGDIFDSFGSYMPTFDFMVDNKCVHMESFSAQKHPLRWFLTRQIAGIFWYAGEIVGDWYPLLRTKAVAKEQKSIYLVYGSCILFNLSKVTMAIYHFTVSGKRIIYDDIENEFYAKYWVISLVILITSILYDFSVFIVLKRHIFSKYNSNTGFLKKFRSISEFRIMVSTIIGIIGLPIIGTSVVVKLYFTYISDNDDYRIINFSLEDLRILIVNVSYYMMFIDQIMLFRSKSESSMGDSTNNYSGTTNTYVNSSSNSNLNTNLSVKPYAMDSKLYFNNLNHINSSTSPTSIMNTSQNPLMNYSSSSNMNMGSSSSMGNMGGGMGNMNNGIVQKHSLGGRKNIGNININHGEMMRSNNAMNSYGMNNMNNDDFSSDWNYDRNY